MRRYNFLLYVPYQLERIMIFGTLLCFYSFLVGSQSLGPPFQQHRAVVLAQQQRQGPAAIASLAVVEAAAAQVSSKQRQAEGICGLPRCMIQQRQQQQSVAC